MERNNFDSFDLPGISYSSSAPASTSITTMSTTGTSSSRANANAAVSDEEVMLASSNPKKRAGRKKFKETRHPVFRGIRKRNSGKWVCEVRQPNNKSRIWLGTYETADMAARAHDVAAIALRGRSACLNFSDSTWRLPIPASSDVKDIQRAAAEAAAMFGLLEESDHGEGGNLVAPDVPVPENNIYTDDEAIFSMPELLADMAEGMMLPPPHCTRDEDEADDYEDSGDIPLWSYPK